MMMALLKQPTLDGRSYFTFPFHTVRGVLKARILKWFYEDLRDFIELKHKKDVLFIIGDWNAKVGSQEIPGVTGEFGLGVQNEAVQRVTEFCQKNALVTATLSSNKR